MIYLLIYLLIGVMWTIYRYINCDSSNLSILGFIFGATVNTIFWPFSVHDWVWVRYQMKRMNNEEKNKNDSK